MLLTVRSSGRYMCVQVSRWCRVPVRLGATLERTGGELPSETHWAASPGESGQDGGAGKDWAEARHPAEPASPRPEAKEAREV